jgi:tRNA nucleotidyltransferase (CCA-adding enzyme)
MQIDRIDIPPKVKIVLDTLGDNGYEAYAVGGCVRDSVLGRTPQDWDVTTSALPAEVKALFPHTIDTGIAHGTVTVMIDHEGFEVTTYRIDGEYEDGRHPKSVSFTSKLTEDLRRRDFTINAMAYNETTGLVDIFGGQEDLKRGVIRCVGEARERFTEDALRMLRAVRFAGQLGFEVDNDTLSAMRELSPNLSKVSAERIQIELNKLIVSDHPELIAMAYETGLTSIFLPEFDEMMVTPQNNPHHMYTVGEHTIQALMQSPPDKNVRLAILFHDIAKPRCRTTDDNGIDHFHGHPALGADMASEILHRLKYDNDTIKSVCALIRWHDDMPELSLRLIRRAINRIGADRYPAIFELKRADILAQSEYRKEEKLEWLRGYEAIYNDIIEQKQCTSVKELAVDGKDVIACGVEPGKQIGNILNELLEIVLDDPAQNERDNLIELIHKMSTPHI